MSIKFENSNTKINLLKAFAGESKARNRYTFAASQAEKDGLQIIGKIFTFTANQEKEHAKLFYKKLAPFCGENIKIEGGYPIDLYNNTLDLLKCAKNNEYEEYNDVYLWETKGQNSKCIVCDEKLEYSEKILLQYMIRNQIHSVQMTGKYCKTCGKVYVLKSDLLNELKKEEITSKDKGKKLRVKNKYVYGSTLVYDENGI